MRAGYDLRRIFQTLFQSFFVQKNKYIIIENVIDDCIDIKNKSKVAVYKDTQGKLISTIGLRRNSIFTGVTEALYLFLSTISSNSNDLNWRFLKSSHTVASKRKDKPLAGNYSVLISIMGGTKLILPGEVEKVVNIPERGMIVFRSDIPYEGFPYEKENIRLFGTNSKPEDKNIFFP